MPGINCKTKMHAVLKALEQWGSENIEMFSLDASPECEEDWRPAYAIIYFTLEVIGGSPYIDVGRAQDDIRDIVKKILGKKFTVVPQSQYNTKYPYKTGSYYCHFHGQEIEIYRKEA